MSPQEFNILIEVLERIADALEKINKNIKENYV